MTPSIVTTVQGDEYGAPFVVSVTDINGNPVGFGNYVINLFDPDGRFPGLLGKKYHGLKQKLSDVIIGRFTSFGTANMVWVPPDPELVRYRGPVPVPVDPAGTISMVEVPYQVYPVNGGNPVIHGIGRDFSVYGSQTEEWLKTTPRGEYGLAHPRYPSKLGSMIVYDAAGNELVLVPTKPASSLEYSLTTTNEIMVTNDHSKLKLVYIPRYVYTNPKYPHTLYFFHNEVFGDYTSYITIDYAIVEFLTVRARDQLLENSLSAGFQLVAQAQEETVIRPYADTRL